MPHDPLELNQFHLLSEEAPRELVHSTAAEGAVTHQDKFGGSMPILKPFRDHPDAYEVQHEGKEVGTISRVLNTWWGRGISDVPHGPWSGPHAHRHQAVQAIFDREGRGLDPDEARYNRDREVGRHAGLTEEEST